MKNIKIFPKDWMQLHPYKQSTPVDSYYTNIANRIYDILHETELSNSFEGDETKQICIRMAAYFEDVISELGIWRAFILAHKELYGKYLPFYTPDDHYYDDEANFEDVRFLLWHFTQQYHGYRKGTFVSPDNPVNEWTARLIYQLFCDEWTTAPENERMKRYFTNEMRYQTMEALNPILTWFHYDMYLFTRSNEELTEYAKTFWKQGNGSQEELTMMLMNLHEQLAYVGRSEFLRFTAPQWFAKLLPADHPDLAFIRSIAEDSQMDMPNPDAERNQQRYELFQQLSGGKLLLYFDQLDDVEDFVINKMHIDQNEKIPQIWKGRKIAIYATPSRGLQIKTKLVECIKDENNPFYDQKIAGKEALSFIITEQCKDEQLLEELMTRNMLPDAQGKSLVSEERSKAIVQENWRFLRTYFVQQN